MYIILTIKMGIGHLEDQSSDTWGGEDITSPVSLIFFLKIMSY